MKIGECHICGIKAKLTKEHIPPKGAFNKNDFYISKSNPLMDKRNETDFKKLVEFDFNNSIKKQGGISYYTLCKKCNNDTGSWYANDYIHWIRGVKSLTPEDKIITFFPLRVIKQVISMFFSLNHIKLRDTHPKLINFILSKEQKKLPKGIRIYAYNYLVGGLRYLSNNILYSKGTIYNLSEILFPPVGFVMSIDGGKPDDRLTEITWFASYDYDEKINHVHSLNYLPTYLQVICDYRSKEQIEEALEDAKKYIDNN